MDAGHLVRMPVAELDGQAALPRLGRSVGVLRAADLGAAGLGHAPIVHSGAMKTGAGLSTADDARAAATEAVTGRGRRPRRRAGDPRRGVRVSPPRQRGRERCWTSCATWPRRRARVRVRRRIGGRRRARGGGRAGGLGVAGRVPRARGDLPHDVPPDRYRAACSADGRSTTEVRSPPATHLLLGDPYSFPADLFLERLDDAPCLPVLGGMASGSRSPVRPPGCSATRRPRRGGRRAPFRGRLRPPGPSCRRGVGRSAST